MDGNTNILVVEDDSTIAMGLVAALEHERFRVRHVDNGEDALAAVQSDPPDLLICDIMLPGIDGLKSCVASRTAIRTCPSSCSRPVPMKSTVSWA